MLRELALHAAAVLPVPVDATANAVRDMHAQRKNRPKLVDPNNVIEMEIDGLEAPSGRLAMVLEFGGDGTDFSSVKYTVKAIQEPDPRKPRRPVRDVIWIYGGEAKLDVRQVLP